MDDIDTSGIAAMLLNPPREIKAAARIAWQKEAPDKSFNEFLVDFRKAVLERVNE